MAAAVSGAAFALGAGTYVIYNRLEPKTPHSHIIFFLVLPSVPLLWVRDFGHVTTTVASLYAVHWVTVLCLTLSYRLSPFHPLANYPGPLAYKATKLSMAKATLQGDVHRITRDLHEQYGDVVRIGPNELSFCRADAVNPILGQRLFQRGPYYDTRTHLATGRASLDGVRDWAESGARRKPWLKAMTSDALNDYRDTLTNTILELCENLEQKQGEDVDLSEWISYFGFDFMGHMAFGREFGMMKAGKDIQGLWHLIEKGTTMSAVLSHIPWALHIIARLPGSGGPFLKMQMMCGQCVTRRIGHSAEVKDLFYYLTGEDEGRRDYTDCIENGISAVVAGSDTAATALTHLCYFFIRHPQYRNKLRKEIEEFFPNGQHPFDPDLHVNMPYLNACINEAMRLYAPVMTGLQRRVEYGTGGAVISGCYVPEGTQVSVHTHSLHRHPEEFSPLPDEFWPDRWLRQDTYTLPSGETVTKDQVHTNEDAFIPFSVGPQNCVGRGLAMMEVRAAACALVQRFDMWPAKGYRLDSWEESLQDVFVTTRGSLMVNMKVTAES